MTVRYNKRKNLKKIFILAGDPSGDNHASKLMYEIRQLYPYVQFIGIGGDKMQKQGLDSIVPLNEISVTGMWEVAKRILFFRDLLNKCRKLFETEKIDLFLPVDYPGFNLKLAEDAKKLNIPVIYYIAPQLWAWGKNRVKKISGRVNLLLAVFPFEEKFFRDYGINAKFTGHPLLDDEEIPVDFLNYYEREKIISFFPGSRLQEIHRHLPLISDIYTKLKVILPGYRFAMAKSNSIDINKYKDILKNYPDIEIWNDSKKLMRESKFGIIKTGTSNLEAALCGLPFSMFYKTSSLSYQISKRLINLPYISLVNILSNKFVVHEYIQNDATPESIIQDCLDKINNFEKYDDLQNEFINIRKLLGEKGAAKNAAMEIKNFLENQVMENKLC